MEGEIFMNIYIKIRRERSKERCITTGRERGGLAN